MKDCNPVECAHAGGPLDLTQTRDGVSPLFTSRRAVVVALLEALTAQDVALLLLWWRVKGVSL